MTPEQRVSYAGFHPGARLSCANPQTNGLLWKEHGFGHGNTVENVINFPKQSYKLNQFFLIVNFGLWFVSMSVVCFFIVNLNNQLVTAQTAVNLLEHRMNESRFAHAMKAETTNSVTSEGTLLSVFVQDYDLAAKKSSRGHKQDVQNPNVTQGIIGTHFRGALPDMVASREGSKIGPWAQEVPLADKYILTEEYTTLNIIEAGLYLIYAQIHYETNERHNTFGIYRHSANGAEPEMLSQCSAPGPSTKQRIPNDVTCYTSVVQSLKNNDRIYLQQFEMNRTVILRPGHSYLGLVHLSGHHIRKTVPDTKT